MVCLLLAGMLQGAPAPDVEPEDELKAAIVLNFLRFAEWPHPAPASPITVGVFGRISFARVLRRTLDGKSVNDRTLRVVEIKSTADAQGCDALYFAGGRSSEVSQIIAAPVVAHALTIGESKDFLELGGTVNLLVIDGRMSFEVNLDALNRTGVNISSKLLRFGQIRGRRKGEPS
jgi:hypothetical protein